MMEDPETQRFADSLRGRGLSESEVEMRVMFLGARGVGAADRIELRRQIRAVRECGSR